jgi:hypothetical protein
MTSSLIVANSIELLGAEGGVPSVNPACPGVVFLLADDGGFGLGAAQPTTDYVASLILDGSRPFGRRADNRSITLPVRIIAPAGAANPLQLLAAAREVLAQAVDQDVWTLTWVRDPGGGTPLPLILDCYRAQPSKPVYNPLDEGAGVMRVDLTIPAKPYGRSDTQVQVPFAAPVQYAPPPPLPPVVIDAFSSISSAVHFQSTQCVVGPRSCGWDPDDDRNRDPGGATTRFYYPAQLTTPLNLTGMTSVSMWLGFGSRWYWCLEYRGKIHGVNVNITLTDTSGNKLSFSRSHLRLPVSQSAQNPCFSKVTMPLPQQAGFDYTSVGSYSIEVVNRLDRVRRLSWVTCYIDALTAYPPSQTATPVIRGNQYVLYGLQGTARAEATLSFQQPPTAGTAVPVTGAGIGTYTVGAGVSWLKVEAVGAGGAGASLTTTGNGGGGGGGAYSRIDLFPVTVGDVIPYNVGAGGTPGVDGQPTIFGPGPAGPLVLTANGGKAAVQDSATGGAGGAASLAPFVSFPGGAGRTASGSVGGGGGGSGGNAAPGLTPTGTTATTFTTPGTFAGGSGWLCPAGVLQVYAEVWGSGASGSCGSNSTNGGGGGGGEYAAGWLNVTPGLRYDYTVAAAGALVNGSGINGNDGASSSFAGNSGTQILAHGGLHGRPSSGSGGSGAGGTGAATTVHHDGGAGGSASPYSGSGGSSAGPAAAGNPGNGYGSATPAPTGGGAGGAGSGAGSSPGSPGTQPGGGGGGTYYANVNSGAGAAGQIKLTYPGNVGAPTSNGAAAVPGGGAGGAGGPSANTGGSNGSAPGGAGGGGCSTGSAETGGSGANGKLIITPYSSQPFKSLIVHRPPLGSLKTYTPLIPVGGGGDAPDGTHQYSVPQPLSGINADFQGTYTIYLINSSWNGSSARTITVTVTQYEFAGGPSYSVSTLPVTVTPSQVTNGIVTAGVLTLPVKQVAADNSGGYYSVSVTDSNTSDRFFEAILLDTQGQTIVINRSGAGYVQYFIDAPDPNLNLGLIQGSNGGRPNAVSVFADCLISGTAIAIEPADGENMLFAHCPDALAPAIGLSYNPAWYYDRFQ